jgi:hypothetical protein
MRRGTILLATAAAALFAAALSYAQVQVPVENNRPGTPGLNAQGVGILCRGADGVFGACDLRPLNTTVLNQTLPPYPYTPAGGAAPVQASATGTTGAVAATLPAYAGKFTYLCGLSVSPGSATTAITITVVVTGVPKTLTWAVGAPVTAVGVTGAILTQTFSPCIPSSAVNTGVVVTSGALGTGGINNDVNVWGFQL